LGGWVAGWVGRGMSGGDWMPVGGDWVGGWVGGGGGLIGLG
jgi:hypothetical protein